MRQKIEIVFLFGAEWVVASLNAKRRVKLLIKEKSAISTLNLSHVACSANLRASNSPLLSRRSRESARNVTDDDDDKKKEVTNVDDAD